jgi:SAM-dependent methyltransferase
MPNSTATDRPPLKNARKSVPDSLPYADLRLRCPRCAIDLAATQCLRCAFRLDTVTGILRALPLERIAHYARFMVDYERIRAAEGRGSESADFYLQLPYRDLSGKNAAQWRIRSRSWDHLLRHVLRPRLPPAARILDLGAGNGWLSFRLAQAGYAPVALDLLINDRDGLGAARHYGQVLPTLFPRIQAELARLPLQSAQFDAVLFNASFHYAEDAEAALREALRCTRTGGFVIISDTPWYSSYQGGQRMVDERHAAFVRRYGTASDSIESIEYLTDDRLLTLADRLSVAWTIHAPWYGVRWALRPVLARLRNRREPSCFRIYVARKEYA